MNKRQRLENCIAGATTDRLPAALWRHFPGDDQRPIDFARAVVDFQRQYDWNFVKVTPASAYAVVDYGFQDHWVGNLEGTRETSKLIIERSLDWTDLRPQDPSRGALAQHLEALRLIAAAFADDEDPPPILPTIFSPLTLASKMAGNETVIRHLRTAPERLHSALRNLTEGTLRIIDAMAALPMAGIFYAIQHASHDVLSRAEYEEFGARYDRQILESLHPPFWFNLLHLHGSSPMFADCASLPVQAINWHDQETPPDLARGKALFTGAVSGGLGRMQHTHDGSPASIREAARAAILATGGRRFILSTGCVAMITSPASNLRAVAEIARETTR